LALGLVDPVDQAGLERAYRELVGALDESGRVVVVAESEGAVVGMAHLAPSGAANATHRAEVQRVAVAGEARGRGVGRALMAAVEDEARTRGLTLLWLTTHDETGAARFYETIGYARLGVMPNYSRRPDGTLASGAFFYRDLGS
jgi:GNAT superfamily N-acetyltransferase